MAKVNNKVDGLMLCYLCNLKNKILESHGEEIQISTGYLSSAAYIDKAIKTLMYQQTEIANLKNRLRIEEGYASAWGDFFGYTPQELTKEEQKALRKHMRIFEEKWKKNIDENSED